MPGTPEAREIPDEDEPQSARDLPAGHLIAQAEIRFFRRSARIPPADQAALAGARLRRAGPAGRPITYDDLHA